MFDIGFFELILIAIIGLVVLGPERLPHAIRMTMAWVGKIRRATSAVKDEIEREVDAHEVKQRIQEQLDHAGLNSIDELQKQMDSVQSLASSDAINDKMKEQAKSLGLDIPDYHGFNDDADYSKSPEPKQDTETKPTPQPPA